jgi:hypothetical protein
MVVLELKFINDSIGDGHHHRANAPYDGDDTDIDTSSCGEKHCQKYEILNDKINDAVKYKS